MKALSLTQPWATLVAIGTKRYETRSWNTLYRGQVAIHASKGFPNACKDLLTVPEFVMSLGVAPQLPLGSIIALVSIKSTTPTHSIAHKLDDIELSYGDYSPNRFAWELDGVIKLKNPIPCKGALGLWNVPEEIASEILNQIRS